MDVSQRFRPRRVRIHMPIGLKELMGDMSREVLRRQPTNIYSFLADYLEAMVKIRNINLIAEQALTEIFKMSKNIYDKLTAAGFQLEYEKTLRLIRVHLERFCLEIMQESAPEYLQRVVDDLIVQMTLLFDEDKLDEDSLRIILETSFQIFLRGMKERNQNKNLSYCKPEKFKSLTIDQTYEDSEKTFLKNFSVYMQKYIN